MKRALSIVGACLVMAACQAAGLSRQSEAAGAFDFQGHMGARGLMPENTLPSFARALSLGVAALVPMCIEQSNQDPQAVQTLAQLQDASSYQRSDMRINAGSATMPG